MRLAIPTRHSSRNLYKLLGSNVTLIFANWCVAYLFINNPGLVFDLNQMFANLPAKLKQEYITYNTLY